MLHVIVWVYPSGHVRLTVTVAAMGPGPTATAAIGGVGSIGSVGRAIVRDFLWLDT
jgi:hypothetical protein